MSTDNQNGVELVRRGYDEPTRCLSFRVDFHHYNGSNEGIGAAVDAVGAIAYNDFSALRVASALVEIVALVDSGAAWGYCSIGVGRENSPVIYIDCDAKHHAAVMTRLREAGPDELDIIDGREVRAWWD